MARSPRGSGRPRAPGGLNFSMDTSAVDKFADSMDAKAKEYSEQIPKALAGGLNEIGDQVVSLVAAKLAASTGLALEQVRGLMKVKRAKNKALTYEVSINAGLLEGKGEAEKLEGKRESVDFGSRAPRAMVVWIAKDDELVCPDCEEMAAAGPMPIEVARRQHPKHPNCRCILLPYTPKGRRAPVTMTTVSGTDPRKRMGGKAPVDVDMTLRQIAQEVINKSAGKLRLELK
jgi:Prophage minor tail protein Z (GPZ)